MMLPTLVTLITLVILSLVAFYIYDRRTTFDCGTRTTSDEIKEVLAYAFTCDMSLEEIHQHLNATGPWHWRQRDSFYYGDYISARAKEDDAMLKIFVEEDGFVFDIRFESSGPQEQHECDALHATILDDVLPSLGARDVQPTDNYG